MDISKNNISMTAETSNSEINNGRNNNKNKTIITDNNDSSVFKAFISNTQKATVKTTDMIQAKTKTSKFLLIYQLNTYMNIK